MYKYLRNTYVFSRFKEAWGVLGASEMVFGGCLDVTWGLGAVFWRLVAGFVRPGGSPN